MASTPTALRTFVAALIALSACLNPPAASQDPPADAPKALPGFVYVPAGQVWPGCTDKDYAERHRGNQNLKEALVYDIWGSVPAFPLQAFYVGRYEVTNAQWKYYLDKEFLQQYTTEKGDTLKVLAKRFVKFRGEGVESEWKAIYALNWRTIVDGWMKMPRPKKPRAEEKKEGEEGKEGEPKKDGEEKKEGEEKKKPEEKKPEEKKPEEKAEPEEEGQQGQPAQPVWQPQWPIENPPTVPGNDVSEIELPTGLKLYIYRTRVPQHWYGWCRLSGLSIGREYCDPSQPPAEAFKPPADQFIKDLALKDTDFAAYPIRSASPNELLAFAEWAGCEAPTEYEYERAARGNNLRWAYPFGDWNHVKQPTLISCAENVRSRDAGPMRVDDESVAGGDSPFGARHMSGNVWELTRTFFDVHPKVSPAPPTVNIANYALVAKGGSFGDGWQLLMVCARTGLVGDKGELSLRYNNRADSLGIRLVRHAERPGYDLLLHSIRRLCYDSARSLWNDPYFPHSFVLDRIAGADEVNLEDKGAPYIYATGRARGTAFAPLWTTKLEEAARRAKQPERSKHFVLGAFRSDVPLRLGVRMTDAEAKAHLEERENYKELVAAFNKLTADKKKNVKLPPPPPPPDEYEKLTAEHMAIWGLWQEKTVAPGEWFVVYWNGFIGLSNRSFTMPPDAIVAVEPKQIARKNQQPGATQLTWGKDKIQLHFEVWEQPSDKSKQVLPPSTDKTDDWALSEACPSYFVKGGPAARPNCWIFDVAFKVAPADDPAWKGQSPPGGAAAKPENKPEKADGAAAANDKKPAEK